MLLAVVAKALHGRRTESLRYMELCSSRSMALFRPISLSSLWGLDPETRIMITTLLRYRYYLGLRSVLSTSATPFYKAFHKCRSLVLQTCICRCGLRPLGFDLPRQLPKAQNASRRSADVSQDMRSILTPLLTSVDNGFVGLSSKKLTTL